MNTKRIYKLAALAVVAAFLATPMASAQGSASFTFDDVDVPDDPITPDAPGESVTIDWTYTVTTNGFQLNYLQTTSTTLTWESPSCTDTEVFATGPLSQTITMAGAGGAPETAKSGKSTFQVSATVDALGEKSVTCTFKGEVAAIGTAQAGVSKAGPTTQDVIVVVDYFGLIQAKSQGRLKEAAPQKTISYDILVSNFGNARTNVNFAMLTESVGEWKPIIPEPIILEAKASNLGGDEQTVVLQISTPFKNGWNNDERTFQLGLSPSSTKDPSKVGNEVQVNVLARVRGVYVPSLEPLALVGAVIGAAMIARMQKQDE